MIKIGNSVPEVSLKKVSQKNMSRNLTKKDFTINKGKDKQNPSEDRVEKNVMAKDDDRIRFEKYIKQEKKLKDNSVKDNVEDGKEVHNDKEIQQDRDKTEQVINEIIQLLLNLDLDKASEKIQELPQDTSVKYFEKLNTVILQIMRSEEIPENHMEILKKFDMDIQKLIESIKAMESRGMKNNLQVNTAVEGEVVEKEEVITPAKVEVSNHNVNDKSDEDRENELLKAIAGDVKKTSPLINNFNRQLFVSKEPQQLPIRANHMAQDVIKSIRFMSMSNLKELTVKVIPKELGEIAIKLTVDSGVMKASITAMNKDTAALLQSSSGQIQDKLQENGIKIESVDISLYEEDTTFHRDGNGERTFQEQYKENIKVATAELEEELSEEILEDEYNLHAIV